MALDGREPDNVFWWFVFSALILVNLIFILVFLVEIFEIIKIIYREELIKIKKFFYLYCSRYFIKRKKKYNITNEHVRFLWKKLRKIIKKFNN